MLSWKGFCVTDRFNEAFPLTQKSLQSKVQSLNCIRPQPSRLPLTPYTMSNRQSRRSTGNTIRGPHSALTDFLASHNISAVQISQDYQRRQREAERQRAQDEAAAVAEAAENEETSDQDEDPVERKKRKRKEEMAIMKIKQSKEFKRRKYEERENEDGEDDDTIARRMLQKAKPLPGQLENCEVCEKRFTVTPYCKTGPDGGLLCTKCSKELKDGEKKAQAAEKKKNAVPGGRKRQTESDRMMGDVKPGSKSLVEHCVKRVADVVNDIDEFGDLPQSLLDRLSQILSKKRVMTSRTLKLFLSPEIDRIFIYDCGKLETEDFEQIFAFMPDLEIVNLRMAGQMKDDALQYMIEKNHKVRHLQLGATNLVSDKAWVQLFQERGSQLESLKLSELNDSLNDASVVQLAKYCRKLKRLKLRSCSHMTEQSLISIAQLDTLEHLSLSVAHEASSEHLVKLIQALGPNLKTLSLENYPEADDAVLEAIGSHCHQLSKLRLTGSSLYTDNAFADLFSSTSDNPPLQTIDLSTNRDLDSSNTNDLDINSIGVASEGFKALMNHSGHVLAKLDLHSCRHISHTALLEAFDGEKQYSFLKDIDLSFVAHVDDVVMAGIFRSCPKLQKLVVFACFNARGARIPPGIAVVGLPNAGDNIYVNEDALAGWN